MFKVSFPSLSANAQLNAETKCSYSWHIYTSLCICIFECSMTQCVCAGGPRICIARIISPWLSIARMGQLFKYSDHPSAYLIKTASSPHEYRKNFKWVHNSGKKDQKPEQGYSNWLLVLKRASALFRVKCYEYCPSWSFFSCMSFTFCMFFKRAQIMSQT